MISYSEILEEVRTGAHGAQILSDGSYIIKDKGWYQLVSPKRPFASRNEVIESYLTEDQAELKIDEIIKFYKNLNTPFKWCISPTTTPRNLGELLKDKGFRSWYGRGMFCYPDQIKSEIPSGIAIERVNRDNLEIYVDLFLNGWDINRAYRSSMIEDYQWAIDQVDKRFHFYIAKLHDEPAGTAGFIKKARSGYLIGGNVLNKYQGKGIYKALIQRRLDDIIEMGISLATSGAREKTSVPILENLGFQTAYRSEIFQYDLKG